ncbi:hypothetical protein KKC22_13535 [Myxococcota bacterium]|nr:hypothetical protein [Myxococcota bacterium]
MALGDHWEAADKAFEHLEYYRMLHPYLVAMRRLVGRLRLDPAFGGLQSTVSMASLVLARAPAKRRVSISWIEEEGQYKVKFVDPPLEFSEPTTCPEHDVLRVIRQYLDRVSTAPSNGGEH